MDATVLIWTHEWNRRTLTVNLDGVTHEESLVQPADGNCINWILGHLIVSRASMLRLLGDPEPTAPEQAVERYRRGSGPIQADGPGVIPLEQLREMDARSAERLIAALQAATPEQLAGEVPNGTVASRVHFLLMHEAYHIGQFALLRRIAGREGAIK